MASTAGFMVKIDASPELVSKLKQIVEENPDMMKLEYAGPTQQPSDLRFSLAEVETIIAIVNGIVTLAKFARVIYKHLKEENAQRLTLKTPLRIVEIASSDAVSEEHILELLKASLRA